MNPLDVIICIVVLTAAFGGYRLGFVTRSVSWLLTGVGLFLAARALPRLVEQADDPAGRNDLLLVAAAVLVMGAFMGQVIGLMVGNRLNLAIQSKALRRVDAVAGGAAGALGVLISVWLLVPAMADVPGTAARLARTSTVARSIDRSFPPPPDTARTLRSLLGEDYPGVFRRLRPAPDLGQPPEASGIGADTAQRVSMSTVKVVGEACGRIQEGSGVVLANHRVITNAHVVAGEGSTMLERDDGQQVEAELVAFDPDRDIAVLFAPDLDRPPLQMAEPVDGDRGAVFGHPGGGPLELSPFEVDRIQRVTGTDIYDEHPTDRDVMFLASALEPGDSGGALVTPSGNVIGVAFAIAPDRSGVAYALAPSEIRAAISEAGLRPVPAGPCTR